MGPPANNGAIRITGGFERRRWTSLASCRKWIPKFTAFPSADLRIALGSGEGAVKSVGVNIGTWHSLQTGSSGSDGPSARMHYEEDFYATLGFGFGGDVSAGATFTAYTSPNNLFNTVQEISVKVARANRINPYGLVAFQSQRRRHLVDEGTGSYLELGAGPRFPLGPRMS